MGGWRSKGMYSQVTLQTSCSTGVPDCLPIRLCVQVQKFGYVRQPSHLSSRAGGVGLLGSVASGSQEPHLQVGKWPRTVKSSRVERVGEVP